MSIHKAFSEIKDWLDINSPEGQEALARGDDSVAFFDAAASPDYNPRATNQKARETNCFAYAIGAVGETLNPGDIGGRGEGAITSAFNASGRFSENLYQALQEGLEKDGLKPVEGPEDLFREGHYLVACFCGSRDFHFMRLNANGKWSQVNVDSSNMVSRKDRRGEIITNPAEAFMGSDYEFRGFYHVPKGGVDTLRRRVHQASAVSSESRSICTPQP